MECKDDSSTDERVQKSSINRNILECKGILENAMIIFYIVLIETYWNVKCINADPWWDHRRVLIETYWNVKFVKIVDKTADHMVLIETYWNVKLDEKGYPIPERSINRNILECKGYSGSACGESYEY